MQTSVQIIKCQSKDNPGPECVAGATYETGGQWDGTAHDTRLCTEGFSNSAAVAPGFKGGMFDSATNTGIATARTQSQQTLKGISSTMTDEVNKYKGFLSKLSQIPNFYDFLGGAGLKEVAMQGVFIKSKQSGQSSYYVQPTPFFVARPLARGFTISQAQGGWMCPSKNADVAEFDSLRVIAGSGPRMLEAQIKTKGEPITMHIPLGPELNKDAPCEGLDKTFLVTAALSDADVDRLNIKTEDAFPGRQTTSCIPTTGHSSKWKSAGKRAENSCVAEALGDPNADHRASVIARAGQGNIADCYTCADGSACIQDVRPALQEYSVVMEVSMRDPSAYARVHVREQPRTPSALSQGLAGLEQNGFIPSLDHPLSTPVLYVEGSHNHLFGLNTILSSDLSSSPGAHPGCPEGAVWRAHVYGQSGVCCVGGHWDGGECVGPNSTYVQPARVGGRWCPTSQAPHIAYGNGRDDGFCCSVPPQRDPATERMVCPAHASNVIPSATMEQTKYRFLPKPGTPGSASTAQLLSDTEGDAMPVPYSAIYVVVQTDTGEKTLKQLHGTGTGRTLSIPPICPPGATPVDQVLDVSMSPAVARDIRSSRTWYTQGHTMFHTGVDPERLSANATLLSPGGGGSRRFVSTAIPDEEGKSTTSPDPVCLVGSDHYPSIVAAEQNCPDGVVTTKRDPTQYRCSKSVSIFPSNCEPGTALEPDEIDAQWIKAPSTVQTTGTRCTPDVFPITGLSAYAAFGEPGAAGSAGQNEISCRNGSNPLDYSVQKTWTSSYSEGFTGGQSPADNYAKAVQQLNSDIKTETDKYNAIQRKMLESVQKTNDDVGASVSWNTKARVGRDALLTSEAQQEDRHLQMKSNNYHALAWGAAAVVLVAASLKAAA